MKTFPICLIFLSTFLGCKEKPRALPDKGNVPVADTVAAKVDPDTSVRQAPPHSEPFGDSTLVVKTPLPGSQIRTPVTVSGNARGGWYFEGSFIVRLLDSSGRQLAIAPASAQDNWMTGAWVPFRATLAWKRYRGPGTLLFEADNPSGLKELEKKFSYAVELR
jgi:hypothetical protein